MDPPYTKVASSPPRLTGIDFERLYRLFEKLHDRKNFSLVFSTCGLAAASFGSTKRLHTTSVYKLLGNFSATLSFFGNFQLVEQFSVHASATSETIKKCRI